MDEVLLAFGLLMAIEGGLYALFPRFMKRMLMTMLTYPIENLRSAGLVCAVIGVGLVWIVKRFLNG